MADQSDPQTTPGRVGPRRGARVLRWAAGTLVAILVLGAFLVWLGGTQWALQWTVQRAVGLSNGQLVMRGVTGSLYGPLSVDYFAYVTPDRRIEGHKLYLDYGVRQLAGRHFQLAQASLRYLLVEEIKPSDEPLTLPDSLELPITFTIGDATIARIDLKNPDGTRVFENVHFEAEKDWRRYQLVVKRADTPFGRLNGRLTLGDTRPFPIDATLALMHTDPEVSYQINAKLGGSLERMDAQGRATLAGTPATFSAQLTPFAEFPVQRAVARARQVNPKAIRQDWPAALIDLAANFDVGGKGEVRGTLQLDNADPGPIDAQRVPLEALSLAFAGTTDDLAMRDIHIDLGKGGKLEGEGRVRGGQLDLHLETKNLDLRPIYSTLHATRFAGDLDIKAEPDGQRVRADLKNGPYRVQLDATHAQQALTVKSAQLSRAGSEAAFSGKLELTEKRPFEAEGKIRSFNPADWGDYPKASLNANFVTHGQLAPALQAFVDFAITRSRFRGHLLQGRGKTRLSPSRIWDADVDVQLASNVLQANGSFGGRGDRLRWRLQADNLAALGPQFAGRIVSSGTLTGTFSELAGTFDAQASKLRWGEEYRIGALSATGRLDAGLNGPVAVQARATDLRLGATQLDSAEARLDGRRSGHTFTLHARNADLNLSTALKGGWHGDKGWRGEITTLTNEGRIPIRLSAPAPLVIAPQTVTLGEARLAFAEGSIVVERLALTHRQLVTSGQIRNISIEALQRIIGPLEQFETTLVVSGQWSIAAREQVDGQIVLRRERGDIIARTFPKTPLGLSQLTFQADIKNNQVAADFNATGTTLGKISGSGRTTLSRQDGVWRIAGNAPLQGQADFSMPSIKWASSLIDDTGAVLIDGALTGSARVAGTLSRPKLQGQIGGERLRADLADQGIFLKNGVLQATFSDDTLQLNRLSFRGGQGEVVAQGVARLRDGKPAADVQVVARKLEILSLPDRLLIVSGTANVQATDTQATIDADVTADRGLIELVKSDKPTLSSDVVVVGREKKAVRKESAYLTLLTANLDLGDDFYLKGRGVDAQLGGKLQVRHSGRGVPRATGSVRVIKGTYTAYGQRLVIERGIINFQGPIDNPGLNILAMRKNQPVEAGVAIIGTALAPRVNLVSNPNVPDSEKLSWLVLGHGLEGSSGQDFNLLQAAAGALLGAGESVTLQSRIAHAAGLEEFSLSGGGELESTVLTLGKRLSSRAYLTFEQGLTGATSLVKINYTLTKRLSVRAQTGTDNAIDLFYTFSFD